MSAGAFVYSRYESNGGQIYRIRVQPETLILTIGATANAAPTDEITAQGTVAVSRGRRSFGVLPRLVRIRFTTTIPDGYKEDSIITLPWLEPAGFDLLLNGAAGTYLGANIELISKSPEIIR